MLKPILVPCRFRQSREHTVAPSSTDFREYLRQQDDILERRAAPADTEPR